MISGAGFVSTPRFKGEILFQMEEGRKRAYIIGGIVLLGAGAGLAYYLLTGKPKAQILSARAYRDGDRVLVEAQAKNVGRKKGCLKLQAILVKADAGCPVGESGYDKASIFDQILRCIQLKNAQGVFTGSWCGLPEGQGEEAGWYEVAPGETITLTAESWQTQERLPEKERYPFPGGIYHLYANVVPSPTCNSADKIVKNGHYLWVPNQVL